MPFVASQKIATKTEAKEFFGRKRSATRERCAGCTQGSDKHATAPPDHK